MEIERVSEAAKGRCEVTLYHGGISGKRPGDILFPSPPHVSDGCPICVARAEGRVCRVWEFRQWLRRIGERGKPVLAQLEDADDMDPIDPPSGAAAVYVTTSLPYARWYAARSQGDLYVVEPCDEPTRSDEDHFPTWTCDSARVVSVVERHVRLRRHDRREMSRLWKAADRAAERGES